MNDNIRDLAHQAGLEFATNSVDMPIIVAVNQGKLADPKEALSKFAELIVRECVDICNQATLQNQDTLSKLNTDELAEKMIIHGSINQAQKLGKGIKEHFGVEE